MPFHGLRTGTFIRWAPAIFEDAHLLPYAQLLAAEPEDCVFEITKMSMCGDGNGEMVFECVKDCGQHVMSALTGDEFEDFCVALGREPFNVVDSLEDFATAFSIEVEEEDYDFEADVAAIVEML